MSNIKATLYGQVRSKELEEGSNIYTIHPPKSDLILFYEVTTPEGDNEWGGASVIEALKWFESAPAGSRLLISAWDSDEEDAHLVGQTIDVTALIKEAKK